MALHVSTFSTSLQRLGKEVSLQCVWANAVLTSMSGEQLSVPTEREEVHVSFMATSILKKPVALHSAFLADLGEPVLQNFNLNDGIATDGDAYNLAFTLDLCLSTFQ